MDSWFLGWQINQWAQKSYKKRYDFFVGRENYTEKKSAKVVEVYIPQVMRHFWDPGRPGLESGLSIGILNRKSGPTRDPEIRPGKLTREEWTLNAQGMSNWLSPYCVANWLLVWEIVWYYVLCISILLAHSIYSMERVWCIHHSVHGVYITQTLGHMI